MIPCKKLKCLKYPACKHKEVIKCIPLLRWFNKIRDEHKEVYEFGERHTAAWLELAVIFPMLIKVEGNTIIDHEYRTGYNDKGDK